MKKIIVKLKVEIKYLISKIRMHNKKFDVSVMSIEETLNKIIDSEISIIRFGDGEFSIMGGGNACLFQSYSHDLRDKLVETVNDVKNDKVLICLPETMVSLKPFKKSTQKFWTITFAENYHTYKDNSNSDYRYGNAFVSRPYMIYKDKSQCEKYFELLKKAFANKEVVIIEGEYSRSGVGNDLFSGAKSVERIICPAENAWSKYDEILNAALKLRKDKLILTSIGPTSKPLAMQLIRNGYRVLDMGHIDSEYEWFLSNATKKEKINGKHTAEVDDNDIQECLDSSYINSIICTVKGN